MEHEIALGIDVRKKFSDMCAMTADGTILLETKIFHDYTGFQHLSKQLISLTDRNLHRITAVMESTAHYHRILENYLQKLDGKVMVINPLQSGSMKKWTYKTSKRPYGCKAACPAVLAEDA